VPRPVTRSRSCSGRRTGPGTSRPPRRRCGCATPRRAGRCCTGPPSSASSEPGTTG
jgi:hypothetical protein